MDNERNHRWHNKKQKNDRTIDEAIGIAKGIIADSKVNQAEAEFLLRWMESNAKYTNDPMIKQLFSHMEGILADGILDDEEKDSLFSLLKSITGEECAGDFRHTISASFPLTTPPPIVTPKNSVFCFTGTFAFGPRKKCVEVTKQKGGIYKNTVTETTDYLVIGTMSSPDWIHTSYGRKIEKAMELRDLNDSPQIISEDTWVKYVVKDEPKKTPPKRTAPKRKTRLSLPGTKIQVVKQSQIQPGPLEQAFEDTETALLSKGWCIFHRPAYLGLAGYIATVTSFIPEENRKNNAVYKNFISKDGEPKTREYTPREERILSITQISIADPNGNHIKSSWEVKTHWTSRPNRFEKFESAWELFLEIEDRYDPGMMVWTKLEDYEEFEPY